MRALRLTLLVSVLCAMAAAAALGGDGLDQAPGNGSPATIRGLTVLDCDRTSRDLCTLVSREGRIVFIGMDSEWFDRIPYIGTAVDVRAPYWASGTRRDAFRALDLDDTKRGWVRPVGIARCLVVHGYVGETTIEGNWQRVELLVPVRPRPSSFHAEPVGLFLAWKTLRAQLLRAQTTDTDPRLRHKKPLALKLKRRLGEGFAIYDIVSVGDAARMPAGRCR